MSRTAIVNLPVPRTEIGVEIREDDLQLQGIWPHVNTKISLMWVHLPTGVIFYEDVPEVRKRGLPINPFLSNGE